MDVQIRLGPGLSQIAGTPRLTVALSPEATISDLLDHLRDAHPSLASGLGSALPVVRGSYVTAGHRLTAGDEVALLSPVSGGEAERRDRSACTTGTAGTREGASWR